MYTSNSFLNCNITLLPKQLLSFISTYYYTSNIYICVTQHLMTNSYSNVYHFIVIYITYHYTSETRMISYITLYTRIFLFNSIPTIMESVLLLQQTDSGPSSPSLSVARLASFLLPLLSICRIVLDMYPHTSTWPAGVT